MWSLDTLLTDSRADVFSAEGSRPPRTAVESYGAAWLKVHQLLSSSAVLQTGFMHTGCLCGHCCAVLTLTCPSLQQLPQLPSLHAHQHTWRLSSPCAGCSTLYSPAQRWHDMSNTCFFCMTANSSQPANTMPTVRDMLYQHMLERVPCKKAVCT